MYALRRENGDVLYFDAVTSIEEQYTSTVTKHPIMTGGFISDHTINDNRKFNLSAVLSDADFNLYRPALSGDQTVASNANDWFTSGTNASTGVYTGSLSVSSNKQFQNNTPTNTTVQITSNASDTWKKFLPETVSQFTNDSIPKVTVTQQSKIKTAQAVRNDLVLMWEGKEKFSLLEYEGDLVTRFWNDVVFTNLTFAQDADTGLGLFPKMQLEQVVYTDVEKVEIQIRKTPNKGRKSGTTTTEPTKEGDDAANGATNKSKQSDLRRGVSAITGA